MRAPFRRRFTDVGDKFLFIAFLVGGILAIIFTRGLGDRYFSYSGISFFDVLAIIIAVSIIVSYSLYIYFTKDRSGVSVDRASDNVYYLGLIFTLFSLAYSLIKITFIETGESVKVLDLLPDFGVALFSTIAGIICRVLLQQMRNDPMDTETQAREELGIAVHQLRGKVGQVIADLNGLSAQMNLVLSELTTAISKTIEKTTSENAELIKSAAENIGGLGSKFNELTTEMGNSAEAIKKLFAEDNLGKIPLLISATEKHLETINENIGEKDSELQTALNNTSSKLKELDSATQKIKEHGEKIESSAKTADEATSEYVGELNKATKILNKKTKKVK